MYALEPISLEWRTRWLEAATGSPPQVSELGFMNLFAWHDYRPVWLCQVGDALLVFRDGPEGRSLLGHPLGPIAFDEVIRVMDGLDVHSVVRAPETFARSLEAFGFRGCRDRDNDDYVYLRKELAELKGRRYHRKKNLVNRCLSRYRCTYEPVGPANLDEVRAMQDRWCAARDCGRDPGLCAEYVAIRRVLDNYQALDPIGGAVRVEGQIEAYAIGESLSGDTAVVHFEKAMPQFQGLYQLVNQWFCAHALTGFEFVNREQDMGLPGLREAKESYHPHHMVEKWVLTALAAPAPKSDADGRCRSLLGED